MLGFSLTNPMDVLTIPTAYQNKTNKMISLSVGVSSLKKKINNKFLNSLTHLRLASFFMEFLLKKEKKAMKTKSKCVCACVRACVCVCERENSKSGKINITG